MKKEETNTYLLLRLFEYQKSNSRYPNLLLMPCPGTLFYKLRGGSISEPSMKKSCTQLSGGLRFLRNRLGE
jgi:hypothetical protein